MKHSYIEIYPINEEAKNKLNEFLGDELLTFMMFEYYACTSKIGRIGCFEGYLQNVSTRSVIAWAVDWKASEFGEWYWSATNRAWLEYLISQRGM